ncbi:MAG: hypothetical protein ABI175_04715, partial [Polyangiales bacterium]
MSKVRVYEIAKQLGIEEAAAITLLQAQGAPVRNRLSAVEQDIVDRARRALERSKSASVVEERIRPTVVRRKATPKAAPEPEVVSVATPAVSTPRPSNGHHHEVGADPVRAPRAEARTSTERVEREERIPSPPPVAPAAREERETHEEPREEVRESREAPQAREEQQAPTPATVVAPVVPEAAEQTTVAATHGAVHDVAPTAQAA